MSTRPACAGFTLLELIVVMAVMAVGFAVATVAISRAPAGTTEGWATQVARAKRLAALRGHPVVVADSTGRGSIVLLPDGRAAGAGLDPLTGTVEQQ